MACWVPARPGQELRKNPGTLRAGLAKSVGYRRAQACPQDFFTAPVASKDSNWSQLPAKGRGRCDLSLGQRMVAEADYHCPASAGNGESVLSIILMAERFLHFQLRRDNASKPSGARAAPTARGLKRISECTSKSPARETAHGSAMGTRALLGLATAPTPGLLASPWTAA